MPTKPHQDEEITNPLHGNDMATHDLADCNSNYILTKEEAQNVLIMEPESQTKISLFDYFINVIHQEYSKLKTHPHYANLAKLLLDELDKTLMNAPSNADIKKIVRIFLNQQDLHANLNSLETFWNNIRFDLNKKLLFQPIDSTSEYTAIDNKKFSNKGIGFFSGFKTKKQNDVEPGSVADRMNTNSHDNKEYIHRMVEERIIKEISATPQDNISSASYR